VPPSIAIYSYGSLTERLQIDRCTQRAANEPLDFDGSTALFAPGCFTVYASMGRTRQHAVLSSKPALAFTAEKAGYRVVDTRRADHLGVAKLYQHRAGRMARESSGKSHGAKLIGLAAAGALGHWVFLFIISRQVVPVVIAGWVRFQP
jgi:hypothetical protein